MRGVGPRLGGGQRGCPGGGTGPGFEALGASVLGLGSSSGVRSHPGPSASKSCQSDKFCGIPEVQRELVVVGRLEVPCCGQGICGDQCWGEWGPRQRGERRVGWGQEAAGGLPLPA